MSSDSIKLLKKIYKKFDGIILWVIFIYTFLTSFGTSYTSFPQLFQFFLVSYQTNQLIYPQTPSVLF